MPLPPSPSSLHRALLKNNVEELHLLRQNPNFLQEINSLGFTPWEMACLLDKKEAKQILNPTNPSFLQVIPKGETEKQILSEKEFGELMGIHYLPCLKFSSPREIEKIQSRCPYLFRYTPLGKENRQIGQGYLDWFFSGELPNLLVKWIDETLGYGLFTEEPLPQGDFIGAYTGLVHAITEQEQNPYCFHYPTTFFSTQVFAIDAAKEGNLLRFLNHSNTPNLQPTWALDRNLLHLTFFTNRPIEKGEQLTFNYGPHFWRHRDVIHS